MPRPTPKPPKKPTIYHATDRRLMPAIDMERLIKGKDAVKKLGKENIGAHELSLRGFDCKRLKKEYNFVAEHLRALGFPIHQIAAAKFSIRELLDAGFTKYELPVAGFSQKQINEALSKK